MTCHEFQHTLSGSSADEMPLEAAIHIEQCTACRHAAAAQAKLQRDLRLVRNTAPPVPPSLDKAVLSTYRSLGFSVSSVLNASSPNHQRRVGSRLLWLSATAAALVLAAVLLIAPHRVEQIQIWNAPAPHAPAIAHTSIPTIPKAHAKKPTHASAPNVVARNREAQPETSAIPVSGFQGLMYCDPLSCPGAMDVVRIQIPISNFNRLPASRSANGYVQADVVVGSDGFARAIRIVH